MKIPRFLALLTGLLLCLTVSLQAHPGHDELVWDLAGGQHIFFLHWWDLLGLGGVVLALVYWVKTRSGAVRRAPVERRKD